MTGTSLEELEVGDLRIWSYGEQQRQNNGSFLITRIFWHDLRRAEVLYESGKFDSWPAWMLEQKTDLISRAHVTDTRAEFLQLD